MTEWKNNIAGFLLFIFLAAIALLTTDQLTDWPLWLKVAPSALLALIGLFALFNSTSETTAATTTTATSPTPPATPAASTASSSTPRTEPGKSGEQGLGELLGALIMLALVGCAIYGIIFIYGLMVSEFNEVKKNYISGQVKTEFVIGHSYNQQEETEYDRRLKKDVIYTVFMLKKGQHWKWYFDHDVYYRLGGNDFALLESLKHTGSEYVAKEDGTLQVRSPTDYNHVTITRLVQN
ncbi:MAG: hypothetical protein AAB766_02205 [Patescibacteria group bacterium]